MLRSRWRDYTYKMSLQIKCIGSRRLREQFRPGFLQSLLQGSFLSPQAYEIFGDWRGGGLRGLGSSSFEGIGFLRNSSRLLLGSLEGRLGLVFSAPNVVICCRKNGLFLVIISFYCLFTFLHSGNLCISPRQSPPRMKLN